MSENTEFNNSGFTPVPSNDPGFSNSNNDSFIPVPSTDPGFESSEATQGFKPVPSTDPGFEKKPSSFSSESFAHGYSKGFSQGFLEGFKKATDADFQRTLSVAKPEFSMGGFGSEGFHQNGYAQQHGYQPPKNDE
jgi:hypothetical protein